MRWRKRIERSYRSDGWMSAAATPRALPRHVAIIMDGTGYPLFDTLRVLLRELEAAVGGDPGFDGIAAPLSPRRDCRIASEWRPPEGYRTTCPPGAGYR